MSMPCGTMSMAWMPMCGQSWIGAAASFLGMWTVMMAAMMLPSLLPMLARYRRSVGRAGAFSSALLTIPVAAGYLMIWTLLGVAVYPLGTAIVAATMRYPGLERAVPMAIGLVVLTVGALQLTPWKAHHLACCRGGSCHGAPRGGPAPASNTFTALRHGMRLGIHCSQCCAGLTALLLVSGIMDVPAMAGVTAGITLERLAPAGERIARITGVVLIGAGSFLTLRAAGLG
jgi:predicted metal-binding membrane protein